MSCISFSYFRRRRCMVGWIPNIVSLVVGKLSDKSSELWLTRELAILYCHRWGILWSRCCRVFLCRSTGRNSCCCDWLREDRPIWQYKYTNINRNTNTNTNTNICSTDVKIFNYTNKYTQIPVPKQRRQQLTPVWLTAADGPTLSLSNRAVRGHLRYFQVHLCYCLCTVQLQGHLLYSTYLYPGLLR